MSNFETLKQLAMSGKLSRREFMSYSAAAGVTMSVASAFYSSNALADGHGGKKHKQGGTFKLGLGAGNTTDSLDPATTTHQFTQLINHALYNYLTEVDNAGNVVPELAESFESTPDAKVWTFKIRTGIQFHNGKDMTPADVIASLEYHRSEDSKSAAKALLKSIDSIKADGNNVVITLSGSNADLPALLSDYHLVVMPSKDGKVVDPVSGVGTGGYVLEKFEPGVKCTMNRNKNFWKANRAHFDRVELISIKDVAARTNALTTGEIHAMDRCDLKTVHLLKRNKNVSVKKVDGTQHYTMPMDARIAPFKDNNVRMAIKHSVDREAMVKTILRGYGSVGRDMPIGSGQKYYNAETPQTTYDPEKAKHYLKKAGMSSLKITISAADAAFAGGVDTATLFKEHAAKSGIDVTVDRVPDDGYWTDVWLKKPMCLSYWGGRPTQDMMFSIAFASDAAWNEGHWKNEQFDKLLVAARGELDQAKRAELYGEMQTIVSQNGSVVIPMFASYVYATAKNVVHDELGANWEMDGLRALERWSFS